MNSYPVDALWHPLPVCSDTRLRRWLLDRGSLTRRIRLRCDRFSVKVLSQRVAMVGCDERAILGVDRGAPLLAREVSLSCGTRPMVFAHSVVERRAVRGPWRMLATLGANPLGEALFSDPRINRFALHF